MREIEIRDESIRLGQLLKLADLIEAGSDAKDLLACGGVLVNGEPETRRGRRLLPGDTVSALGETVGIVARGH